MQASERRTNPDRSASTRAALLAAARSLFVTRSYAGTGTPEIVAAAKVTRGALYHHFPDKRALFKAVIEREAVDVAAGIERAAPKGKSPLDALLAGGAAFLDAMAVPGRTRLLLIEAPAVLGHADLDAIDAANGGRTLRDGLTEAGVKAGPARDALAELLSAAYDRAALAIDAGADRAAFEKALAIVLRGIVRP